MNLVMQYILQEMSSTEKKYWYLCQCVLKTIEIFNLYIYLVFFLQY